MFGVRVRTMSGGGRLETRSFLTCFLQLRVFARSVDGEWKTRNILPNQSFRLSHFEYLQP